MVFFREIDLQTWSWFFLIFYIALMFVLGGMAMKRVESSDDFATARSSYGPIFLAFALTATTASGGTFIGLPALAYSKGVSALFYAFSYPLGVYLGVLLCLKGVRAAGASFGNRTIPEYLGDRYQSEAIRIIVSLLSILLLFYLAGQLLSGAVMFNKMMGLNIFSALLMTGAIIMLYIVIGGAHADILTDGVQGGLMILLAIAIVLMFFSGFGLEFGYTGLLENLENQDSRLLTPFNNDNSVVKSKWDVFSIFVAHIPLGLLPHIGNKIWALKSDKDRVTFITCSFILGMTLPCIALGGLLARGILGDDLLQNGSGANYAIPALFIATLPSWMAAFIGAGVLAAVMSTADGLLVSTSQIFANDIFRRSIVPKLKSPIDSKKVDKISLAISRFATALIVVIAIWLAYIAQGQNVAIMMAAGIGAMLSATSGPIFVGILWRKATRLGALCGLWSGAVTFFILKLNLLIPHLAKSGFPIFYWLNDQSSNPFSCITLGIFVSVGTVIIVSLFSEAPEKSHLEKIF